MGNTNSPEHSPDRLSRPRRLLSNSPKTKSNEMPVFEKPRVIRNLSKINKILSKPKNIMTFISQTENLILLKNLNDSTNIGLNHLNILIENTFNNPFLEDQIKYLQIIDDLIDKKIKLNYQNRECNQKQMENLINNLIEINDNSNNINIGNISSIHKKNGKFLSREESPISQRDDELDLTSFSTTIGGKISPTSSNYNKNQNSKQIKTFKIKKKNGLIIDGNYNSTNNNINNYKNISSRQDSPTSLNSIISSNNISNVLSSINATNFHSKNSSNTSLKEKNSKNKNKNNDRNNSYNNNIINNTMIKENNSNSNNYYINNNKTKIFNNNNAIKINKIANKNNKIISKKVVKKTLITPQKKNSGPQDNTKQPRKSNINNDINKTTINNTSNIHKNILSNIDNNNTSYMQNNLSNIENNNDLSIQNNLNNISNLSNNNNYINNKKGENNKKIKIGFAIPKLNITDDIRAKSPNSILNNKILNSNNLEEENENSQIIFNNVRTLTQRNNYSYSNNNSSMINNMSSLNQNSKINNTNIIDDKKYIKILNDSNSSHLKTEPNKDNNSYTQINANKKKIINEKNKNPFKNKTYKIQGKINQLNNRNIRKVEGDKLIRMNTLNVDNTNNNILSKDNKTIDNEDKIIKATSNKKIIQRKEGSLENIQKKKDISKCTKNIIKKKINDKNKNIIINTKKLDTQNNLKINITSKNNITKGNNNVLNNKKQEIKQKKVILFDDNLDNINFLDEEFQNSSDIKNDESKKPILNTEEIFNKKKIKPKKNITIENKTNEIDEIKNKNINNNIIKNCDENKNKIKKKIVKKPKKQKINNMVFNIDLSNDKDDKINMDNKNISDDNKSKSEDISDNSLSHEEKIQIKNLEGKIGKPLKDKNNIINNDNKIYINNKKNTVNNNTTQNKINKQKDKFISFDNDNNKVNIEKNKTNLNNNNKKIPKLIKETNNPNSKINRLVFDKSYDNIDDDLDDVCNFSGINNKSYTNICDYNYKNDIFNDFLDEDLKRAHSPKIIIHKKKKFDLGNTDNIDLKNDKCINNNNIENDNNDIFQNININNIKLQENTNNDFINIDEQPKAINIIKNKCNNIKDNNITNILSKNVSNYSNDNFSFKVKNNEQLYNSKKLLNNLEKENKQLKNESIIESCGSSKFNFKINDDIHESEFNDIDFLD